MSADPSQPSVPFEFASAGQVLFGRGRFRELPALTARFGSRVLLVTCPSALAPRPGPGEAAASFLEKGLAGAGISSVRFLVRAEPTTTLVDEGARLALASGCEAVIGLGGGSVLDAAKAIAGLMTNGGGALDYLEVVGGGRSLASPAAPFIAVPTTAGTGAEVTRNAVLAEPRARVKASIRSAHLLPAIALVDPDLTLSLPPALTASTGLDALTQLIEGFLSARANPVSDALALEGIGRSARSLPRALADGGNPAAREELALASLLGGLVLANAGLGAVHGIAAPLGGRHPVPHGVACALLLPHVFRANLEALRELARGGETLGRMARVGLLLRENVDEDLMSGAVRSATDDAQRAALILDRLVAGCALPGLATFGVTRADVRPIAEASLRASSMKGNPVPLSLARIEAAITAAL